MLYLLKLEVEAPVAQWIEYVTSDHGVGGSTPFGRASSRHSRDSAQRLLIEKRAMMNWYVYILECKDGSLYTGITVDLKRREKQHNLGIGAKSLLGKRPVKIIYTSLYNSRSEALKREHEIKGWRKEKKLALIQQTVYPEKR